MKMTNNISALIKIAKKWAKTRKIEPEDAIIAGILVVDELNKTSKYDKKGKLKRKYFAKKARIATLTKQNYKCNMCKKKLDEINYDHIDGNRSNNSVSNCQALCPNCHAKKTRKKKK